MCAANLDNLSERHQYDVALLLLLASFGSVNEGDMSDVEVALQSGAEARAHLEEVAEYMGVLEWATDFAVRMLDVSDGLLLGRMSLSRHYATDTDVQCLSKFLDLSALVVNVRADGERATCILLPEGGALEPPVGKRFPDGVADFAVVRACDHYDWV